jgi:hypothetical protein
VHPSHVNPTEVISFLKPLNFADRITPIRQNMEMAAVICVQLQDPHTAETQLTLCQSQELIPKTHRSFQGVNFPKCEGPKKQPRIPTQHFRTVNSNAEELFIQIII